MSISSDVYITRKEAIELVKRKLLLEQEELINYAVNAMEDFALCGHLHTETEFYNIEGDDE